MPIYQYKCESCGEQFDRIEKFSDEPLTTHRKCGGPVHRMLTAPAFQFKGSGWYATDYAKAIAPPSAGESGSSEKSADSKTETKTETKTDSKSSETKSDSKSAPSTPAPATTTKTS